MQVDVAVIGAGTAGLAARREAHAAGARTLLINDGPWTTTCIRVGCMPSKLLLAAADTARAVADAGEVGIAVERFRVDGAAVMRRLHAVRARFLDGIAADVDAIPAAEKLSGRARFTGPTTLAVGETAIEARAVVIATGSRPAVAPFLEPVRDLVLTTDEFFELTDLPASLAVIGAGPLGIELAIACTRLGVATEVFDHGPHLGGLHDPEVAAHAAGALGAELAIHLDCEVEAEYVPEGVRISWRGPDGTGARVFERVLAASGRPPDFAGLALESAGLALDAHGTPRFDPRTRRCGPSAVFIAGDAGAMRPVLHEARASGELAGRNAARLARGENTVAAEPMAALSIVFTDPDLAIVGASLESLGADGVWGACDFDAGRGRIENRSAGLVRLYARRSDGTLAGAEMAGPAVEHLAHLVASWVGQRTTVEAALALPFYHPTFSENLLDCLRDLASRLG